MTSDISTPLAPAGAATRPALPVAILMLMFAVIVVLRFGGLPDQFVYPVTFYNNPGTFQNDFYLQNTFIFSSSIYYAVNRLIGLETSDILTLIVYCAVVALMAALALSILRRHFGVTDDYRRWLMLVLLALVDQRIPSATWGLLIPVHPGSPSMFGALLAISVLYLLLARRLVLATFALTALLALHPKANILLLPISVLYVLLCPGVAAKNLMLFLLPVAFALYKATTQAPVSADAAAQLATVEAALQLEGGDADFWLQTPFSLAVLCASFAVFPVLVRRIGKPETRALLWSVYLSSLGACLGGMAYTGGLYRWFPNPMFVVLGPVRALTFYVFFFFILLFLQIETARRIPAVAKPFVSLAAVLVHGSSAGGVIYPAILAAAGGAFAWVSSRLPPDLARRAASPLVGITLISALVAVQVARGGVYYTHPDALAFRYMGRWTVQLGADEPTWQAYTALRDDREDYILIPYSLDARGRLVTSTYWNIYARKSVFSLYPLHVYFKPALIAEHQRRVVLAERLDAALRAATPVPADVLAALAELRVRVAVPAAVARLFPLTPSRDLGAIHVLGPEGAARTRRSVE